MSNGLKYKCNVTKQEQNAKNKKMGMIAVKGTVQISVIPHRDPANVTI